MADATEGKRRRDELRKSFLADALKAEEEAERTGLAYDADEVHAWLKARARGVKAARPKPKPWRD